jgi:hypothetical protein
MSYQPSNYTKFLLVLISLVSQCLIPSSVQAAITNAYCQIDTNSATTKENLRQASLKANPKAQQDYEAIIREHGKILAQCRRNHWLQEQAIWLRLYPCDAREGAIDEILDRIVNLGYNTVYLEVFFDSQVLLPKNSNYTPWPSVVDSPGIENRDLLAETIKKGRERGLKVYAWLFSLNFGYLYAQRPDRQNVLARNGKGENSLDFVHDRSQAFVDPYHPQAREDYNKLLQAVLQRRPDGVLFDYIRYPRGSGEDSVASRVKQLWIYGEASQRVLLGRAQNQQGRWLLERYINKGSIDANDVAQAKQLYPQENTPLWQGRSPNATNNLSALQLDLWYFTVAHAAQGVIDFLELASNQVERQGITAGTVFFPEGNQVVGQTGFDSRLQPWDYFSSSLERHPMSYAMCNDASCIVDQVKSVINASSQQTKVAPVLAGLWGQNQPNRPSLEVQMEAIRTQARQIKSISHFSFSWLEPEYTRQRSSCNL